MQYQQRQRQVTNGPICAGSTLSLSTPTVSGATYSWTGPNSFSSLIQNPSILNATTAATGTYSVTVKVNNCSSPAGATTVTVKALPTVSITGSSTICAGATTTLSPATGGTWVSNSPSIASVTNAGVVTAGSITGTATFTFTSTATGCSNTTSAVTVDATCQVVTLTEPAILSATVNSTNITCFGGNTGAINITSPTGGYGTYQYTINGSATSPTWQGSGSFTGLAARFLQCADTRCSPYRVFDSIKC